jgi:hypothetical protein
MPKITFFPWFRRGLSNRLDATDPLKELENATFRSSAMVKLKLLADGRENPNPVQQKLELLGAGDITGFSTQAIVKTDPLAGVSNFEPNFLPYIDFYEEDFPWRYTPGKANQQRRLRPWLILVVLREGEFERLPFEKGMLNPVIRIFPAAIAQVFPNPSQTWAWAHVQVNAETDKPLDEVQANPNRGVSRLICPRKLNPFTAYSAFVLPAFEIGRLAGLGAADAEIEQNNPWAASWSSDQDQWPVYYTWNFQTGAPEDFESLARRIKPVKLGTEVGKHALDISNSDYGGTLFDFKGSLPGYPVGIVPLEGALKPLQVNEAPTPTLLKSDTIAPRDYVKNLCEVLNLGVNSGESSAKLSASSQNPLFIDSGILDDDPLIVPPIYGRVYTQADDPNGEKLDLLKLNNWQENLNLDPALRVAAGVGVRVVQENQESFMEEAWQQLGELQKLNRQVKVLQLSKEVSQSAFQKHFLSQDNLNNHVVSLGHSILRYDTGNLDQESRSTFSSSWDTAFLNPAYRRITRSGGPISKRAPIAFNGKLSVFSQVQITTTFILLPNNSNYLSFSLEGFKTQLKKEIPIARLEVIQNYRSAVKTISALLSRVPLVVKKAVNLKTTLDSTQSYLIGLLNPNTSFTRKYKVMSTSEGMPIKDNPRNSIQTFSFNPQFNDPAYEYLVASNREMFVPNLQNVPEDSFSLFEANPKVIEAFMVGLNHEMAREFLWRGFPADAKASFFHRFWDYTDTASSSATKFDIEPLQNWKTNSALGAHKPGNAGRASETLFFVIRARLVLKYPNPVVYAVKAEWTNGVRSVKKDLKHQDIAYPSIRAFLDPDYLFVGFEGLKEAELPGSDKPTDQLPGWYFVFSERPGEVHFGMDVSKDPAANNSSWDSLTWSDLPQVQSMLDLDRDVPLNPKRANLAWGKGPTHSTNDPSSGEGDAAQMAAILYQKPVSIIIHASNLIQPR